MRVQSAMFACSVKQSAVSTRAAGLKHPTPPRPVGSPISRWQVTAPVSPSSSPALLPDQRPTFVPKLNDQAFIQRAAGIGANMTTFTSTLRFIRKYQSSGSDIHLQLIENTISHLSTFQTWWYRTALTFLKSEIAREHSRKTDFATRLAAYESTQRDHYLANIQAFNLNRTYAPERLNTYELRAISGYMKPSGSTLINNALRGTAPLTYGVYRKIYTILNGLTKLSPVDPRFPVYRGTTLFPGGTPAEALIPGAVYSDDGFLSTSFLKPSAAAFGPHLMKISHPTYGRDISVMGQSECSDIEEEVLFAPHTPFRYLGYDAQTGEHRFTPALDDGSFSSENH